MSACGSPQPIGLHVLLSPKGTPQSSAQELYSQVPLSRFASGLKLHAGIPSTPPSSVQPGKIKHEPSSIHALGLYSLYKGLVQPDI